MTLPPDGNNPPYTFTAYGDAHVCVNTVRHDNNIIVLKDRLIPAWTRNKFASLTIEDMEMLAPLNAEVILFGTGRQLRFPSAELMRPFVLARKVLDVMDIHAACRTYNLLSSEGRSVAAVLLFD